MSDAYEKHRRTFVRQRRKDRLLALLGLIIVAVLVYLAVRLQASIERDW